MTAGQQRDQAASLKGPHQAFCMTQWKIYQEEKGNAEAAELLPGVSRSSFFNPHLPHKGPIV